MDAGYDDTIIFSDYDYDSALIGVTTDGRAVYDFDLMISWLIESEGFSYDEAIEWIDYNTIRALPYGGPNGPIVMYVLESEQ